MKNLSFDEKYALIKLNSISPYITAVKTTGIFCKSWCPARTPKAENVIFYDTATEAIKAGFRPCKICKPMEDKHQTPEYIKNIIKELNDNPGLKITDYDLKQRGVAPNTIRRWFKAHHNITFHGYQRMLRINHSYRQISTHSPATKTAFDSGYKSLSGFNYSWKNIFGTSVQNTHKQVINIDRFSTKLGTMFACATDKGICLLEFSDRRMLETEFKDICSRLDAVILPGENKHLSQVQQELNEYFSGKRKTFDVPLDMVGTVFQKSVWEVLLTVPYGITWSYKQEAEVLGKKEAVRAVANANGANKVAIIIPCHRIISHDGTLGGYGGGLERKQFLLDLEGVY